MHLTASRVADLLRRYGLRAGRRRGQHFLVDPNTVERIVRLSGVGPGETVLEIGPGLGSLTLALSRRAFRVVAVEVDPAVAMALREVVGGVPNVEIVVADALRADLEGLVGGRARLVANLPYDVATPLFLRVLEDAPHVAAGLVMVQREVGERWTAPPGGRARGAVSVRVAYRAEARIAGEVSRSVFFPPPRVDSVLVSFERHLAPPIEVKDEETFFTLVGAAFSHRRKTVRNALVAAGFDRARVEHALGRAEIESRARPESLELADFARLAAAW